LAAERHDGVVEKRKASGFVGEKSANVSELAKMV
jgi:hypothetical protein